MPARQNNILYITKDRALYALVATIVIEETVSPIYRTSSFFYHLLFLFTTFVLQQKKLHFLIIKYSP